MPVCDKCGVEILEGSKFCHNCGKKFENSSFVDKGYSYVKNFDFKKIKVSFKKRKKYF